MVDETHFSPSSPETAKPKGSVEPSSGDVPLSKHCKNYRLLEVKIKMLECRLEALVNPNAVTSACKLEELGNSIDELLLNP